MRALALVAALVLAGPARAEDGALSQGLDLLSQGSRLVLEGLKEHLDPALEGLKGWLDNLDAYEMPEVLPNGDIIIRRKPPKAPGEGDSAGESGAVDL